MPPQKITKSIGALSAGAALSRHGIEALESRIAPANFVLPAGQGPFTLELDPVDSHIHITSGAAGELFDQGLAPGDDLFVTGGGPGEAFTIASSAAGNVSFTGTLSVIIPGPINVAAPVGTGVDLVLNSTDAGITYSPSLALGTSTAHFTAARNIILTNGSALTASSGNIVLLANQAPGQNGSFIGIVLDGASISTTGTGTIQLDGTGGNASNDNVGISLFNGSVISSTSNLATAGTIGLTGKGGAGLANNQGVSMAGASTLVTSVRGAISVTGFGAGNGTGNNVGVLLSNGAQITSTGAGANAATIAVNGTGGGGSDGNHGVFLDGSAADPKITSVDGDIQVTGTGLATAVGQGSRGISLEQGAQILATGAATINLMGTAGAGTNNRAGILVADAGTLVSAANGAITLTGTGGGGGAGSGNPGVLVATAGSVTAQGLGSLTLTGTEGAGANSEGIVIGPNGTISSPGGSGLSLTANNINLDPNAVVNAAAGVAKLQPRSAGNGVNLGGPDVPTNILGLTDGELDRVVAASVEVGSPTSGPINVGTDITSERNLALLSSALVSGGAAVTMGAGLNLTINAAGGIDLSGAITVPGTTALTAGAAAAITLTNVLNAFSTVSVGGGGTVSLRDDSGFDLGASLVSTLLTVESVADITQSAPLTGTGALAKNGAGTLTLSAVNTYNGTTTVNAGTLQVGGAVGTLGGGAVVNNGILTFNRSTAYTVTNAISGTGNITKSGSGALTLGGNNTYSGATTVIAGTMLVDGTLANTTGVTVSSTATLGGNGTISAPISVSGFLVPGGSPGTLTTGNVALQPSARFNVEINGIAPSHDQLVVNGAVDLNNATFNTSGSITTMPGQPIVLIANDGIDPVINTFFGLAEGAPVNVNGLLFTISYAGGTDNNDVVLAAAPSETEVTLVAGDLTITDIAPGGHNATLTVQDQSGNGLFVVSDPNHNLASGIPGAIVSGDLHTVSIPATAVTGTQIVVNALGGDDSLTVDFAPGALTKALVYNGGAQAAGGDVLMLSGPALTTGALDFADAQSGAITLGSSAGITYSGVESVNSTISAANLTLNYNANGPNTVTVADAGGGKTNLAATTGAALAIVNPTLSLTINGGPNADTINLNSLSAFPGAVSIDGKAGADAVNLGAGLPTLAGLTVMTDGIGALPLLRTGAGGLDITATASAIDVNGGIISTGPVKLQSGGAITNAAGTIAAGNVTLTAPDGITVALDGASITATVTGNGGATLQAVNNPVTIVSLAPGTGGAFLNGGTFLLSKTDAITSGAALIVGGTLDMNGSSQTVAGPSGAGTITNTSPLLSTLTAGGDSFTFSGNLQGHLALAKIGAATLTLSGAANNYDGGTTITAGTLQFNASGPAVNGSFTLGGGTLFYNFSNPSLTPKINLTEPSSIGVATGELVALDEVISGRGGLTKTGGGTLVLANELNTFGPAAVTIDGGILQVATDGALGDVTNRIVFNNSTTLKTTGSFASGRQIVQNGPAIIDVAGGALTLIGDVGDQGALQTNHTGGLLQFAFVFVDNLAVVTGNPVIVGGTTVTASGNATVIVHTVDGLGLQIDTIELSNTTSTTNLTIKGPGTINRIVSNGDLGSIVLGTGVLLGDGVRDSVTDLEIAGKATKLQLYDLNSYVFIDLGKNLPYEVLRPNSTRIDTTKSQTKTNRPNLTIHEATGPGVLIDVTGDGTPAGVGGGGLGKVIVEKWNSTGIPGAIRTTQSIGSFKLLQGNSTVVFEVDKYHLGSSTSAAVGSMTIQNGSWGSSGSEIEGAVGFFNANDFLAGATLTAGSMGKFTLDAGAFAGLLTLTDPDAAGIPTFTVATNFTGSVDSESPLRKINVKGEFRGELEAPFIGSINAYAFIGTNTPGEFNEIVATEGSLGTLTASAGVVRNFSIVTDQIFKGFNVKLRKLTDDTIGIDNVHIQALAIGNITVSLAAAAAGSGGIDLVGIRNSEFITTGTGTTKSTMGSIGNITITLTGTAGGNSGTGIVGSTFDALVEANEFVSNPASTLNALGKIAVKITGQDGPSLGLDDVAFLGNSIGATTVSVSRGKDGGSQASGIDQAEFTATGAIGAMTIDGDATSAQVLGLDVWAGANVGAITVKATKVPAHGTISDSSILAGQSLALSPATTLADLTKASLGAVNVTGSLVDTQLAAGGSIGAVTVGGGMTDSLILAGAKLGADLALGGAGADADTFQRAAAIAAVTVKGASGGVFARTSIIAGVNPVNGIFGDAGDLAAPAAGALPNTSSIGAISLPAGVLASVAGSQQFGIQAAKITSLKLAAAPAVPITAMPKLLDLAGADDVLVKLIA